MTDAQRQYYLRQQLKTIQDELGEGEKTDAAGGPQADPRGEAAGRRRASSPSAKSSVSSA